MTIKSFLTTLNIIYFSLIVVMSLFAAIVFYLSSSGSVVNDDSLTQIFRYILFALLPLGFGVGYFVFKQITSNINPTQSLRDKLFKYQTAIIIRSACFEMPGLLGAVATLITGDNSFLLFTLMVIVMFLLFRPSIYNITSDLSLNQNERAMLENPSTVL